MGIILNDGVRLPVLRIDTLHFAANTPYETRLINDPDKGVRVMPSEVATALREALSHVVDAGTARRVSGSFTLDNGTPLAMGGKTGTGDNRIESMGGLGGLMDKLPNMGGVNLAQMGNAQGAAEKQFKQMEAIINSMTIRPTAGSWS